MRWAKVSTHNNGVPPVTTTSGVVTRPDSWRGIVDVISAYPPGTDPLLAVTIDAEIAAGYVSTEPPPTEDEWAAAEGAHRRHLAAVRANPISKAAFDRMTARIERRFEG